MARKGDGSSMSIKTTSAVDAAALSAAYSFAFWFKSPRTPSGGTLISRHPFSMVGGASNEFDVNIAWDHVNPAAHKALIHRESGGTIHEIQITSSPAANTWHHIAATYDGTTARVWFNGVNEASKVVPVPDSTNDPIVAIMAYKGTSSFDDGTIAEVAVWTVALDTAEVGALADAVSPMLVRPTGLMLYWPLIRDAIPFKGEALTVTANPSVQVHPRVYYPASPQILRWTNNTQFTHTPSGGITIGGGMSEAMAWTHTPTGGLVVGGSPSVGFFQARPTAIASGRRKVRDDG